MIDRLNAVHKIAPELVSVKRSRSTASKADDGDTSDAWNGPISHWSTGFLYLPEPNVLERQVGVRLHLRFLMQGAL